jgi:hypothetical protein
MRTVELVRKHLKGLAASLTLCAVALTGCGASPSSTYTGDDGSYLRLPGVWTLFDGLTILRQTDPDAELADGVYINGFALGQDDPAVVLTAADAPTGMLLSADIPEGSTADMDKTVIINNLNELLANGAAKAVEEFRTFEPDSKGNGERGILDINDVNGKSMRMLQMTVTDPDRGRIWVLAITCNTQCFTENKKLIEDISTTWKVDTKR